MIKEESQSVTGKDTVAVWIKKQTVVTLCFFLMDSGNYSCVTGNI